MASMGSMPNVNGNTTDSATILPNPGNAPKVVPMITPVINMAMAIGSASRVAARAIDSNMHILFVGRRRAKFWPDNHERRYFFLRAASTRGLSF